jgi:hypothetical protein
MNRHTLRIALLVVVSLSLSGAGIAADSVVARSVGQTVYIPIYSHIYSGDKERPVDLAATLSVRNTDPGRSIMIMAVDYYNSEGKLLRNYLSAPVELHKMATLRYVVKESDKEGGSGANFVVRWQAGQAVVPPLIESVMISTQSQQGISFTSRGKVISERTRGKVISERTGVGRKNLSDIPPDQRP